MVLSLEAIGQPGPGDVFREYAWIPHMIKSETGKFLRVGGNLDYRNNPTHLPPEFHRDGYISFGHYLQLDQAIKAELVLEKVASHEDTKGLRVSINQNTAIQIPAAKGIPEPEADYMHHTYPVTPIPLSELREGWDNSFQLEVDTAQRWNWPQNLIYGVILRVYYQPETAQSKAEITGINNGDALGRKVILEISDPDQSIRQVDYLGLYEGINYEGDGIYRQWHYHYLRGNIKHHLGTAMDYPYKLNWNTEWVPDQQEPLQIAARIVDNTGLIYFTAAVTGLSFDRDFRVALGKPYNQPKNWVTREGEFQEKIDLKTNPERITDARLIWVSWSPCYTNGVFVNQKQVLDKEGPCYDYMAHNVPFDPALLKSGTNVISTGKEPLHDGNMVHGMEVQWPGIMLLIRY
ncbi:MAG: hypothetical protein DHS20C17_16380 [Cyclobacteriaceae bacterium]|nr:MAG: hypothetical protein DHS20C17_16380 [Cyclobacteriaceae bacterium]